VNKTLVIVLAETRASEITFEKFKSNLLEQFDADLALCVGNNPNEDLNNSFYHHAKFIWTFPEKDDWGESLDEIALQQGHETDWRILLYLGGILFGGVKGVGEQPGSGCIQLVFRAFLKQVLLKENVFNQYDQFILTRSDYLHEAPHMAPSLLTNEYIWIPDGECYGGYTDRHIVCSSQNFLKYLNIVDAIFDRPKILYNDMKFDRNWNIEKFLKFRMDSVGLSEKVKLFPPTMFTVRGADGKTSWQLGEWNDERQFYIKYKKEYRNCQTTKALLERSKDWSANIVSDYFKFPDQQRAADAKRQKFIWLGKRVAAVVLVITGFILGRLTS
jgi:hypothetical protein